MGRREEEGRIHRGGLALPAEDAGQPGGCGWQCVRRDQEGHRRRSLRVLRRVPQEFLQHGSRGEVCQRTDRSVEMNQPRLRNGSNCVATRHEDFKELYHRMGCRPGLHRNRDFAPVRRTCGKRPMSRVGYGLALQMLEAVTSGAVLTGLLGVLLFMPLIA